MTMQQQQQLFTLHLITRSTLAGYAGAIKATEDFQFPSEEEDVTMMKQGPEQSDKTNDATSNVWPQDLSEFSAPDEKVSFARDTRSLNSLPRLGEGDVCKSPTSTRSSTTTSICYFFYNLKGGTPA